MNNLPLIADDKAWFGDRFSPFAVIIEAEVWKTTPFMALLLLRGLATIDEGLYEAAQGGRRHRLAQRSGRSRCR